jgi:hypothetical protein
MKRIVQILAAGLLLTAAGACNNEVEKAPEVTSNEGKKAAEAKPAQKAEPSAEAPASAPAKADKGEEPPMGDPPGPPDVAASDKAEADKAAVEDEPSSQPTEAGGADAVADGAEGDKAGADADAGKEAQNKNPMDEIEPGGVYKGPPAKAIRGTWSLTVSKAGMPAGLPKELQKELDAIKKVTMKFDGKKVVVDLGKGKKNTLAYTVKEDSKISATLTTKAGEEAGSVQVTFLDNDNILINSTNFPVQMKGKRTK